jgi:metal-dependent amidase/aminoacylase/carboxypeptidase family protein
VGTIQGGTRHNIVPDSVKMTGTIRTFDPAMRTQILERVKRTAENIAAAAGATAEFTRDEGYPVTWNDPVLTERMTPSLKRVAVGTFNPNAQPTTTSEDFSFYGQKVPALYFFLGVASKGADPAAWAANHSAKFSPDEAALITGVRALASVAVDYLAGGK